MANGGIIGPVNDPTAFTVNAATDAFTASGTFTAQIGQTLVDYLVIAGGGSGAIAAGSCQITTGGGGAGGLRTGTCFPVSPNTSYPVTIGAGGAGVSGVCGGPYSSGNPGNSSIFSTITATGGGGGGVLGNPASPGGSGGGAAGTNNQASGHCNVNTISRNRERGHRVLHLECRLFSSSRWRWRWFCNWWRWWSWRL
jgi:hypothetical protein